MSHLIGNRLNSVVPFSLSRDGDPLRETLVDPNKLTLSPDQMKSTQHYLGLGSASQLTVNALSEDNALIFMNFYEDFCMPYRETQKNNGQESAGEEECGSLVEEPKKTPLNSSWQNKRLGGCN